MGALYLVLQQPKKASYGMHSVVAILEADSAAHAVREALRRFPEQFEPKGGACKPPEARPATDGTAIYV